MSDTSAKNFVDLPGAIAALMDIPRRVMENVEAIGDIVYRIRKKRAAEERLALLESVASRQKRQEQQQQEQQQQYDSGLMSELQQFPDGTLISFRSNGALLVMYDLDRDERFEHKFF